MRRLIVALVGGVVVVAVVGAAQTSGGGAQRPDARSLSVVSASGAPLELPAADVRTQRLRGAGLGTIEKIAVHDGHGFYRFRLETKNDCYGSGSVAADWPIGVVKCNDGPDGFPSQELPILDISLVGLDKNAPGLPRFISVQGVAADGVARIELQDVSGAAVATVTITNNVYWLPEPPRAAVRLAALDAAGHVLATVP